LKIHPEIIAIRKPPMKNILFVSVFTFLTYTTVSAQIISKFTWETNPVTTAVIGPNANSVSSKATSSPGGAGGTNGLNAGTPSTDVDLIFSSVSSLALFDGLNGILVSVDFKRKENTVSFLKRGASIDFGMDNGDLYINFLYKNGSGGSVAVNSGSILTLPSDNLFHTYSFLYDNLSGKATVQKDGITAYTNNGVAGRAMFWTGAGNLIIGQVMDGTGTNVAILDNLIIASPTAVLPLTLVSFNGYMKNGEALLTWETVHESNTAYIAIEKSSGSSAFAEFSRLNAVGNYSSAQYSSTDGTPFHPDSYYRLKIVDLDARYLYSPVIHIGDLQNEKWFVYPNPATSFVWLKLTNTKPQNYQLCIYSTDGKTLASRSLDMEAGSHELKISLPAGNYKHFLLTLTDENGSRQTFKIAKE
jgi:hypothetical protein